MSINLKLSGLGNLPLMLLLAVVQSWWVGILSPSVAQGQTSAAPQTCTATLDPKLLRENPKAIKGDIITDNTISPTGITIPSLWWTKEQIAPKMLIDWFAYPNKHQVDLVVNRQLWGLQSYIERYSFVNKFGAVAREFGYNVRVFNELTTCIASYNCNFTTAQPNCQLWIESSDGNGLGARHNNF